MAKVMFKAGVPTTLPSTIIICSQSTLWIRQLNYFQTGWNASGSSPHKDILRYPEISWDILRYPNIRISQDIFSGYLKDISRISQRYLPRRYPKISFDIFIRIFLCIFLLIYWYLFAYPEISFFLSAVYPWYIFLYIFQYSWIQACSTQSSNS